VRAASRERDRGTGSRGQPLSGQDGTARIRPGSRPERDPLERRRPARRRGACRVVCGLFFFPRGGSAEVVRALAGALPDTGWKVTLAAGSLGRPGEPGHAPSFFAGLDLVPVVYGAPPSSNSPVPFPPSYEDKPGTPDRVFALVDDHHYELLVQEWERALQAADTGTAQLLHLHHLTPINEAARRSFPHVPIVGQLHGTELAFLRAIQAGPPARWRFADRWAARMRAWASTCERLIVPPGAGPDTARLLGLTEDALVEQASGVDLTRFTRRPLTGERRRAHWRRWLVEQPLGWDESGRPGSIRYREQDLWPFRDPQAVVVYAGRYTAVKRLPLLVRAHTRALARLERPLPLILVGGYPGEWEGEHPHALVRALGNEQVFLAGWHPHERLPAAFNAADLLALPSAAEAFGLVLVEAMACGLPVIATNSHGPAEIVRPDTGWLLPADDEQALTQTLVEAASDADERRRRGNRAHAHSRAVYGWPSLAARIASLYSEIAELPDELAAAT
jgi:glycosyltransferase involved in cell wall biosynthesis